MQFLREEFKSWLESKPPESRPCYTRLPGRSLGRACPLEVFYSETQRKQTSIVIGTYIDEREHKKLPEWAQNFAIACDQEANENGRMLWAALTTERLLKLLETSRDPSV